MWPINTDGTVRLLDVPETDEQKLKRIAKEIYIAFLTGTGKEKGWDYCVSVAKKFV